MSRRHYTLPDLPTVCPYCGTGLSESEPFAQVQTHYLRLYSCPEVSCGPRLFSAVAGRDRVSGSRIWTVDEV